MHQMKKHHAGLIGLVILSLSVAPARLAAHCEVPCGIYGDQRRFEQMLEDHDTIAKAILQIHEISGEMEDGPKPNLINQSIRWVNTKEEHATRIQHTIAQYFMTQRIKADKPNYAKALPAAHKVMVAAMKCKQAADPATAGALKKAILDFYRAQEGKEPSFHTH
jgi:nickel superoxide dismutase